MAELHLYIDDSGSRNPDYQQSETRRDEMNCFALGGILVKEEEVGALIAAHKAFCAEWKIVYPLHSHAIRGGREKFGWLKKPENALEFLPALEELLLGLPIICIAAVLDRPGYVQRYAERYEDRLWLMCKTAFSILIERAAKHARREGRKLRVYFEQAGKAEDRALVEYTRSLKTTGMPFDQRGSAAYASLSANEFREIVRGEPRRRTKKVPMIQLADLVLYPIAKGGYDSRYRPYAKLVERGKLIDSLLSEGERPQLGVKYSCFERIYNEGPD
jgi:hypothetical protein